MTRRLSPGCVWWGLPVWRGPPAPPPLRAGLPGGPPRSAGRPGGCGPLRPGPGGLSPGAGPGCGGQQVGRDRGRLLRCRRRRVGQRCYLPHRNRRPRTRRHQARRSLACGLLARGSRGGCRVGGVAHHGCLLACVASDVLVEPIRCGGSAQRWWLPAGCEASPHHTRPDLAGGSVVRRPGVEGGGRRSCLMPVRARECPDLACGASRAPQPGASPRTRLPVCQPGVRWSGGAAPGAARSRRAARSGRRPAGAAEGNSRSNQSNTRSNYWRE